MSITGGVLDDTIFLRGMVIARDLSADLGDSLTASGNQIHLSSSAATITSVNRHFYYTGGNEIDNVDLSSGAIHGNASIYLYDGNDNLNLSNFGAQTIIGGNLYVNGGD